MANKGVLVVIVLAALVGLFLLFGGAEWLAGTADPRDPSTSGDGTDPLHADAEDGAPGDGATDDPERGPILFGRSRAERAGVGGLRGRIMDFDSGKAIAGATVVVAGVGYADEQTALQEQSDENGYFRYAELAAGDAYTLHVNGPKDRTRTLQGVQVDADGEKDVGVLWLGKASPLEGVILDAAGLPVAAADVQVHEGGGSLAELLRNLPKLLEVMDRDAVPAFQTATEKTGRFVFEQVAPGPYTLVVRATGYQMATRRVVMTSSGVAGGKVTVRVAPAQAITGVVVDERDRPVQGARVACMVKNDMESAFFGRQYSETNSDGRFRIDAPPSRSALNVIVAAEGYPTLFTEARAGEEDLRFVLVTGTEVLVRIVEKDTQRPIEGASLMAMFADSMRMTRNKMTFGSGRTDARGEVLFSARPSKLQMLYVSHPERGNAMFNPMMSMMGGAATLSGPKDTTVKPPRTELVFTLAMGVTIRGKVTDTGGKPLPGVRVSTVGMMGVGGSTLSDAQGAYELQNQSPPILFVSAEAPGYVQKVGGGMGMGGVMARPAGGVLDRDLKMQPAAAIAGRVVDARGRPLSGVEVKVGADRGSAMLAAVTGSARQTITNAVGRYVLDGVMPGARKRVVGHAAGYLDSRTPTFEVEAGVAKAPDLVMQVGSRIRVKVVDASGGAVGGARVEVSVAADERILWDPMTGFSGFADLATNAAGKADVDDLPDGTVTLTATKKGHAAARERVTVKRAESDTYDVVLALREAVTLTGRVIDAEGKPIEGAAVQAMAVPSASRDGPEGPWVPGVSTTTDTRGRFELEGLPAVLVQVVATAEGYQSASGSYDAGGPAVEIRLEPVSTDTAKRIKELDEEIQRISARFADVKDEAERAALGQRLMVLQREKAKLQEEGR